MDEYRENALSYENGGKVGQTGGKQSENKEVYFYSNTRQRNRYPQLTHKLIFYHTHNILLIIVKSPSSRILSHISGKVG